MEIKSTRLSGVVEIVKSDNVPVAKVSEPGAPLGEMSLLVGTPISATARGSTRKSIGSRPIVLSASISSLTLMLPR